MATDVLVSKAVYERGLHLADEGYEIRREIYPGIYEITDGNGKRHEVDAERGTCDCLGYEHRKGCAHLVGIENLLKLWKSEPTYGQPCYALVDGEWIRATYFWPKGDGFTVARLDGWNQGEWTYATEVR